MSLLSLTVKLCAAAITLSYADGYSHCCYCVEDGTDTALNNVQCPSDAESIAECSATIDSDGSCLESNGAGVKCYSSKFLIKQTNKQTLIIFSK